MTESLQGNVHEVPVVVDPRELVCVHLQRSDGGEDTFRVVSCRYVQVHRPDGPPGLGLELVYDPSNQAPGAAYYASPSQFQVIIVPAGVAKRIHPYGHS